MSKPFLAFDVDGTIFKSSLAEKIVEQGIAEGLFSAEPFNAVYDGRRRWQEDNNEEIYQNYLKQLVGVLVVQMAGVEVERFNEVTANMLSRHEVRKFRLPRLMTQSLADTHTPVVLSGSPDVLVRPFVADMNITTVYGSTYEVEGGRFTGAAKSIGNKALLLHEMVERGSVSKEGSVAMGDTISDVPMLEYADKPVIFNGSKTLTTYGRQFDWDRVGEVKDNITVLSKPPGATEYRERELEDFLEELKAGA